MTSPDRDVTIDIIGRDKTDAATKSAIRNFQQLQKQNKANEAETDKLSAKWKNWESTALSAVKAATQLGAKVAAVGSLVGPATTSLIAGAKATAAFAKGAASVGAEVAPLLAYVPALAGSVGLLAGTTKIAGAGIAKALKPLTDEFAPGNKTGKGIGSLTTQIQGLASKGVAQLAKQFVKVNLPTIATGMDRIAVAENKVVIAVGKWINSASGQQLVKQIVGQTATFAEQLGPHFSAAVIAVGNLAKQATGLNTVGSAVGKILDKFTNWANSIDSNDINAAFATILRGWGDIQTAWGHLKAVVDWMSTNQGKIKAFSSSLAAIGVVFGVATGDLPAAATAAFSLVFNNLDKVKGALKGINTAPLVKDFDNVKTAASNFLDAGKDIASTFGPTVMSALGPVTGALKGFSVVTKDIFGFVDAHKTTFQAIAVGLAAMYTWTKLLAVQEAILTAVQIALDVAEDANPVGLIVLAVVGLVAAIIYLWKNSSAFRGFFIAAWNDIWGVLKAIGGWFAGPFAGFFVSAWNVIKIGFNAFKNIVTSGINDVKNIFITVVGAIISGAAKAFGWIPGIGPKLKQAAADFAAYKNAVNGSLAGIHDKTITIKTFVTGSGAKIIENGGAVRAVGSTWIAESGGLAWAPATAAANFLATNFARNDAGNGGHSVGGPTPVQVNSDVTVMLDGQPFRAMTARAVTGAMDRQAWRQKVGRR